MQTVSHYEVLEKIGEGGMGVVYRALDTRLERDVALKFLSLDFTGSESLKERFILEAKAASALDHQNICTIHAIEETDDGRLFIAMGYYQGETVKAKLREQGPLPWQDIVDLSAQIASGLQAAHERGIIHLDIKPANLMVTPGGQVKILDFGLSRFTSELDRTRPQGPLMGTVAYMAPELVQGEETGPESDVWALGVVMYEMATGLRPFQGKNDMAVLYAIVHKDCAPPCEKAPDLPEDLGRVIRRALVKDRRHRYQSTTEVLADLEPFQQHQSSKTNMPMLPEPPRRKLLRRTAGAVAAATLLLLFLIQGWIKNQGKGAGATDVMLVGFEGSPDSESSWVGLAFAEMLMCRLPGNEKMRWKRSDEIDLSGVGSASDAALLGGSGASARRLRQGLEIEWTLGGEFQVTEEEGETRLAIELALQETESGAIKSLSLEGNVSELPDLVARAAGELVPLLGNAADPVGPAAEASETPVDPAARELLGEAQRKLRVGEAKAALGDLREAIEIESESPILHLTLSEAQSELNLDREARMAAKDALKGVRGLPWRDQIYYCAWHLETHDQQESAAAVYRAWWAGVDPAGDATDLLTLDRGVHLGFVLARVRQSAAARAVVDRLAPLLGDDPRVALIEVESYLDERLEDEQAAAARAVELARQRRAPLLEARGLTLEGQAWQRLGEYDKAVEELEAAREIYSRHEYKGGEAGVLNILANVQQDQRNYLGAKTSNELAAQLYTEIGNRILCARVLHNKAPVLDALGELGAAIEILNQAMPIFVEAGDRDAQVVSLINLGDYQMARGQFKDADQSFDQAIDILDSWRNSRYLAAALTQRGHLRVQQGDLANAHQILNQAIEEQEEVKDQIWTAYARSLLAHVLYHQGMLPEALRIQESALEVYSALDVSGENAEIRADMGRTLMAMGDLDGARENFDMALEPQNTLSNPGPAAQTGVYQAQLLFAEDRIEESVERARKVLAEVAENQDFMLVRAQAHVVLGRGLLELGEADQARQELEKARALLADTRSLLYELPVEILEARLMAFRGAATAARTHLQDPLADASRGLFALMELEVRLALGEIALGAGSGQTGRNQLQEVVREARQKGFGLIAMLSERALAKAKVASTAH